MKREIFYISMILCLFVSCQEKGKQPRTPKQYTIEQLYNNVSVGAAGFNSDEAKILVDNNSSGIYNVYELSVSDTSMKPLTASKKESFFAVDYLPGTEKFIFSHDQGGNENSHLYLMSKADTSATDLTPWTGSTIALQAGVQIKKPCM